MFAKLFSSMFDGTLASNGPWEALVTFQQMLILCDRTGIVDMTPEALSRRTTIPVEIIRKGITALEAPDPSSRRPDEEGRRIVRIAANRPWGWQIVNYEHYRQIRDADQRREYQRDLMRERRAAEKDGQPPKKRVPPARVNGSFNSFWVKYPRHEKRAAAEKAWMKLNPDEALTQTIMAAIDQQKATGCLMQRTTADGGSAIPHASSWLNGKRWQDEVQQTGSRNVLHAEPGKRVM